MSIENKETNGRKNDIPKGSKSLDEFGRKELAEQAKFLYGQYLDGNTEAGHTALQICSNLLKKDKNLPKSTIESLSLIFVELKKVFGKNDTLIS